MDLKSDGVQQATDAIPREVLVLWRQGEAKQRGHSEGKTSYGKGNKASPVYIYIYCIFQHTL